MSSIFNSLKSLAGSHSAKNGARSDIRPESPPREESDFNQWVHAMRMVVGLPGGVPSEFRKKLWLSLAEKHLHNQKVDWPATEKRCFSAFDREDDEELGNQIVKDLHRTGSSLFSGPDGAHNQAILKKVLIGYARWNESVGYCQGFNMLGAFMLQVMDKSEVDSLKVMIFLIEGVMPPKYFSGTLSGLITDMSVFRELLSNRLPKLSQHLDRLQGIDNEGYSFEPPLTNVFTMQWFLTLFCTCLPHATVLRIWDLIFLEGNEILLRTALMIWECFSERILCAKSADEFYSMMVVLSKDMLEYGFKDANTFIKKVVDFGPISRVQDLRAKYNYNIKWTQSIQPSTKERIRLFYSDDESYSDSEQNRMAVTAAYGWTSGQKPARKNSLGSLMIDPERLTMDINALKQQYLKLRERQRQAHLILTAACARQTVGASMSSPSSPINHFLLGKNAILNTHGRRLGPALGSIPPPRIASLSLKASQGETLHWKDTDSKRRTLTRANSIKWKDIPKCQNEISNDTSVNSKSEYEDFNDNLESTSGLDEFDDDTDYNSYMQQMQRQSDSSSYSEESNASSSSTELCDEPNRLSDFDPEPSVEPVNICESAKTNESVFAESENATNTSVCDGSLTVNEFAPASSPLYNDSVAIGENEFIFNLSSHENSLDNFQDTSVSNYIPEMAIENIALTIEENKNLLSRVTEDRSLMKETASYAQRIDTNLPSELIWNKENSLDKAIESPEFICSKENSLDKMMELPEYSHLVHGMLNDNGDVRGDVNSGNIESSASTIHPDAQSRIRLEDSDIESSLPNYDLNLSFTSYPQYDFQETGRKHSERALQIIEENSKILHRISQCNLQNNEILAFDRIPSISSWKYDENVDSPAKSSVAELEQSNERIINSSSKYDLNFTKYIPSNEPRLTFKNYFIDKEKLSPIYRLNSDDKIIFNIPSQEGVGRDMSESVGDMSFGAEVSADRLGYYDFNFKLGSDDVDTTKESESQFDNKNEIDSAIQMNETSKTIEEAKSIYNKSSLTLSPDFDYVIRKDLSCRISPISSTSISSELRDGIRNPYGSVLSPSHYSNLHSILSMNNKFAADNKISSTLESVDYSNMFTVERFKLEQDNINDSSKCDSTSKINTALLESPMRKFESTD